MEFTPSKNLTVGIELELQLLDSTSLDLADGIVPLMTLYPDNIHVKPEFIQNTVEITSKVCNDVAEAHAHLKEILVLLKKNCAKLDMLLCGAGTHPFGERLALITPLPRYLQLEKLAGYLGHTQITYATHVHVGMHTGDQAIKVMRQLKAYLPLLIALSASSPFWRGYDTGFVSYRHRILSASRSYGIPPSFESWQQFNEFFEAADNADVFKSMNDIHWDIRPRPHLGTVEMRVMDAQPTLSEAVALAALVRTLAAYLQSNSDAENESTLPHALPWWLEKENHYQASRLGLNAKYIYDENGNTKPLLKIWHAVVHELQPLAVKLGEWPYIEQLCNTVAGINISYIRQRDVYKNTGSFKKVVATLIEELDNDVNQ